MADYTCYILDDEPLAIKVIEQYLDKLPQFEICGTSTDPLEALAQLKQLQPELLFLDIEMPELTGLELIESMHIQPEIILTTAYREYAVEGFEWDVLDYLVKPIPFQRFVKAIDRFLSKVEGVRQAPQKDRILVRADRKTLHIALDDILYVEGLKDYVKIVLHDQRILTKMSLGNFHDTLPQDRFLRVHKSYLVAKDKITAFTAYDVEIGEKEIPIGRVYKEGFLREMG